MLNKSLVKSPMPEQNPEIRNRNFSEVSLGYLAETAKEEAARCLNCKNKPCVNGCPVNVKIPEFIEKIAEGRFDEAYEIISATNSLPAICGRVCPQENQCEGRCVRGIKGEPVAIGRLERFCADYFIKNFKNIKNIKRESSEKKTGISLNKKKIAVIGSGPAGLACAGDLAKLGYFVTVFEAFHTPGGVLMYGIPEFRLPKEIVKKEIENLKILGVEIITNVVVGKTISIDELFNDYYNYKACFIGSGAGLPSFMNIEGETLIGVFSANEYLTRINLMKAHLSEYDTPVIKSESVAVVGGGNVAMDAARCAKRLGAKNVHIVYRRGENEMPTRKEEIHHAIEEGVMFKNLSAPIKLNSDANGRVCSMDCVEMELGEPDSSGRRKPVVKPDSNFILKADTVIMAIGTSPNPLISSVTEGLRVNSHGCILADANTLQTAREKIYAGGDAVTGAATVILAMGAGKRAAASIHEYLLNQINSK